MIIHQGDQYQLPIQIKTTEQIITPTDCTDVRIKVGDIQKSYAKSEISWDATNKNYLYPLLETETFPLERSVDVQVAVKFGTTDFVYSAVYKVPLCKSIIKGTWAT